MNLKCYSKTYISDENKRVKEEFDKWNLISETKESRLIAAQLEGKVFNSVHIISNERLLDIYLYSSIVTLDYENAYIDEFCTAYIRFDKKSKTIISSNFEDLLNFFHYEEFREIIGLDYLQPQLIQLIDIEILKKILTGHITSPSTFVKNYLEQINFNRQIPLKKLLKLLQTEDVTLLFSAIRVANNPHYLLQKWECLNNDEKELIREICSVAFVLGEKVNTFIFLGGKKGLERTLKGITSFSQKIIRDRMQLESLYSTEKYNTQHIKILSTNIEFLDESIEMDNCLFTDNYFFKAKRQGFYYLSVRFGNLKANVEIEFDKSKKKLIIHQFEGEGNAKLAYSEFAIVQDFIKEDFTRFICDRFSIQKRTLKILTTFEMYTSDLNYTGEII